MIKGIYKWLTHNIGRIKQSASWGAIIISWLSTIAGVWGYTIRDIPKVRFWSAIVILILLFVSFSFIVYLVIYLKQKRGFTTRINGKPITIKIGDIFKEDGLKVIPCNEYFDTKVDDVIVSRNTLHGKMIAEHIEDVSDLERTINEAKSAPSKFKPYDQGGRSAYPLGRIIKYQEFLMLSFSHFDEQNVARITVGEYEQCLTRMWEELRRTYSGQPLVLPLIGGGLTTIEGIGEKNPTEMVKCILCTLRRSKFAAEEGLTIVLLEEKYPEIDLHMIKEEFK